MGHGFCGIWGVLASGIFGTDKNAAFAGYHGSAEGYDPIESGEQFGVQLIGVLAITAWTVVTAVFMFGAIHYTIGLRVDASVEEAGLDASEHGGNAYIENHKGELVKGEESSNGVIPEVV